MAILSQTISKTECISVHDRKRPSYEIIAQLRPMSLTFDFFSILPFIYSARAQK